MDKGWRQRFIGSSNDQQQLSTRELLMMLENHAVTGFRLHATAFKSCIVILGLVFTMMNNSAVAQVPDGSGNLPGQTELQNDTGNTITTVCLSFVNNGAAPGQQQALFDDCTAMVSTGEALRGTQGFANTLNLTLDELNAANQQWANEELAAPRSVATKTIKGQLAAVGARIAALQSGAKGFSVVSLDPQYHGSTVTAAQNGYGKLGGAAGADDTAPYSKLGGFITPYGTVGDKDATDREDGFDFYSIGVTAGLDYRFTDNFVFGSAFSYTRLDTEFDNVPTVAGGDVKANGYGVSLFGLYSDENWYLNGIGSYRRNDYDLKRRIRFSAIDSTATADTDSDQFGISVGGGYEITEGQTTYGPHLRVNYLTAEIDGYTERGPASMNLRVKDQYFNSLTTALGGGASYAMSKGFGVLVPQIRAEWIHEFKNDERLLAATFVNDPRANLDGHTLFAQTEGPDRDYFTVLFGLSTVLRGGLQGFVSYERIFELKDITSNIFNGGVRYEF
jgi:outer membrane lipase/esterase